jgi:hypothetical protein
MLVIGMLVGGFVGSLVENRRQYKEVCFMKHIERIVDCGYDDGTCSVVFSDQSSGLVKTPHADTDVKICKSARIDCSEPVPP